MDHTCKLRIHFGAAVDLSCAETYDALSGCEAKLVDGDYGQRVHIKYRGAWYCLGKTSLLDDVATGIFYSEADPGSVRDYVEWLRDAAQFGARIKHYPHGDFFSVVSHCTDG